MPDDLNIDFSAIEQNPEPVEEPEGDRAAEVSRGGKGGKKKTKGIIISVIAALVVIAAIIGGVWYWRSSEQRQESHQLHQDVLRPWTRIPPLRRRWPRRWPTPRVLKALQLIKWLTARPWMC